ncbi:MAG TPA: hypothetical protein VGP47_00220 [Parachlamydiaceae bacterium]|nr:hypothetical protein [Parachlamydiaceae bacterium]
MKNVFLWLLLSASLCSCHTSSLTVQTDYLTHKDLASYYVNTPDPRQNVSAVGQRLIVCWSIPKCYLNYENLHLEVTIRYRNREEIIEIFHLLKNRGTYVYSLFNEEYIAKRGILTYKVAINGGGCILKEWRHQIWTDLISIDRENDALDTPGINNLEDRRNNVLDDVKDMQHEYEDEYPIDWKSDSF